ncbi:MAG: SAP domain-containing protein [Myxococcota bacterium]
MPKPSKRSILQGLTVGRLRQLCRDFEIGGVGRARKQALVDALVRARQAKVQEILGRSGRDELKAICRAHGLDDTGRQKARLVARILGEESMGSGSSSFASSSAPPESARPEGAEGGLVGGSARPLGMRTSFYHLEFGVGGGGAHKDTHYVRRELAEIRRDLDAELLDSTNIYLLCWYGAALDLDVYQHGDQTRSIDLHPYLTIRTEGYPEITFDEHRKVQGHQFRGEEDDDDSLTSRLFHGRVTYEVSVAWERIDVPPLSGEVVGPSDLVNIHDEWELAEENPEATRDELLSDGFLPYGWSDPEA